MTQPHEKPTEVLLIEDDPHDARLFMERLRHFAPGQYHVTQARTLAAALDETADRAYTLAVIDLTLPDSAGLATCSKFQSERPGIPYIVLTGVSGNGLPDTLQRAGAKAALVKDDCSGPELVAAMKTAQISVTDGIVSPAAVSAAAAARFRNAIIDTADGIVVLDSAGKVVLVSGGAESLLGRSTAELIGTELGLDLRPGTPVRAQVMYEEAGLSTYHSGYGTVRQFDVCRLRLTDLEFWPFAHTWAGKPVTVCAMRDVSGQVNDEHRQRDIISIDEPLYLTNSLQEACADMAVRLGRLVRFNRFEVSAGMPDHPGWQVVFELGMSARGREMSAVITSEAQPTEFASWACARSTAEPHIQVAIGHAGAGIYGPRDHTALDRCAGRLSAALARSKTSPLFATTPGLVERNIREMTAALHEAA